MLLAPGGRFSPPTGSPLPPGAPVAAVAAGPADQGAKATLAGLMGLENALPASGSPTGAADGLSPTLASAANAGAMTTQWMRALQSSEHGTESGESLLTESADAVTPGDTPLAPTSGARDTPQVTAVVWPTSAARQPAFEQALGERLVWLVQEGRHDARIKLHPAELGSIDIRLSLDGDSTRISLASPHAVVRDALEQAVPRLRELLSQSGLDLSQVNVGTGDARSHGDFAGRRREDTTRPSLPVTRERRTRRLRSASRRGSSIPSRERRPPVGRGSARRQITVDRPVGDASAGRQEFDEV
jgi:flagellar hook-length control protein FliK